MINNDLYSSCTVYRTGCPGRNERLDNAFQISSSERNFSRSKHLRIAVRSGWECIGARSVWSNAFSYVHSVRNACTNCSSIPNAFSNHFPRPGCVVNLNRLLPQYIELTNHHSKKAMTFSPRFIYI